MMRLIAFLTIENINLIIHSDLSIKSDRQSSSWTFQIYSLKFQFSWKYLNFFLFLDFFQVPFISFWKVTDFVLKLVVLPPEHFGFLPCFGICNLQFSIFNLIFQFACFVLAGQQFTTTSAALLPLQKDSRISTQFYPYFFHSFLSFLHFVLSIIIIKGQLSDITASSAKGSQKRTIVYLPFSIQIIYFFSIIIITGHLSDITASSVKGSEKRTISTKFIPVLPTSIVSHFLQNLLF